jgi:multidrug efflux pump subunit AcrA (membrane-fusion protein)
VLVTAQSIQKAQDAYNQFAAQAAAWLAEPGHTGGSLTSMITGFSRGGAGGGDEAQDSEPEGQELLYSTRVSLERTRMQVDDRMVSLSPGMAVTVEIKTGSRHVIEYLLSPLLRHKQQAMREQ